MSQRKRTISALLNDDVKPTTIRPSRKTRSVSRIINEEFSEELTSTTAKSHGRRQEPCYCSKCKGKLVDSRTKTIHEGKDSDVVDLRTKTIHESKDSDDDQDSEHAQEATNPSPSLENHNKNSDGDDEISDNNENPIQRMEMVERKMIFQQFYLGNDREDTQANKQKFLKKFLNYSLLMTN